MQLGLMMIILIIKDIGWITRMVEESDEQKKNTKGKDFCS
jgi:hypothetical protein